MSEIKEETTEELEKELKEEVEEKPQESKINIYTSKLKKITLSIYDKTRKILGKVLDKVVPSFAPKIEIDKKLIPDEVEIDHVEIKHFNEFQILFGLNL